MVSNERSCALADHHKPLLCLIAGLMAWSGERETAAQEEERETETASETSRPRKSTTPDTPVESFGALPPGSLITFNLEDADLTELVWSVSDLTGQRFIVPSKLRTVKATVIAPTKVTVAEAYQAFLSVLEVNGYTVVPSGPYLKIEATEGIEKAAIPLYVNGEVPPASDRFITRIHHTDHVASDDIVGLLERFPSPEGSIVSYRPTNMLVITDTARRIERMLAIIEAVDLPRTTTQTWLEQIHYARASELGSRLLEVLPAGSAGTEHGESGVRNIIADDRTNSLIIIATEPAYLRILELTRLLDVALEGDGRVHLHYVQHGSASDIAGALTGIVASATQPPRLDGAENVGRGPPGRRPSRPPQSPRQTVTGSLLDGEIAITAYEPANALLIASSFHDYAALKHVIESLDAPRKQVFIEAVVMELAVERSSDVGVAFHGGGGDFPTDGSLTLAGFNPLSSLDVTQNDLTGLALGVQGPTIANSQQLVGFSVPAFGVVVTALAAAGDADVLSTPHIIAIDNTEAEISVGENIPLQTNASTTLADFEGLGTTGTEGEDLGALAGLAGGVGSVARQDVGTTIRITPHINENDDIRLEIEEEISEQGVTSGTLGVVSINRRTARTEVMVRDQQTIVIGGLIRDTLADGEDKVPVLGDVPILGALFRRASKQRRKTNLLLILTPYVIRDPSDLHEILERKLQERQQVIDRYFVFGDDRFEPYIDYSRARGLVAEIINEIEKVEEEIRNSEAIERERPPEDVSGEPIESGGPTTR